MSPGLVRAWPAAGQQAAAASYRASLVEWALSVHEPRASDHHELKRAWERAREFYLARNLEPAWLADGGAAAAHAIAQRMRASDGDGLDPAAYNGPARVEELEQLRVAGPDGDRTAARVDADVRFTLVTFRFASDLALGRWGGEASDRVVDLVEVLSGARDEASARTALDRLEPAHPEYRALRDLLARHRDMAGKGGWPRVPPGLRLVSGRPPARSPAARMARRDGLARLRTRLQAGGDLQVATGEDSPVHDLALKAALRRFQARHGLSSTGDLDAPTVAALNVPVEDRIRQVALNMDRWRRLPQDLGRRHLRVNTPEFVLRFVVDGEPRGTMKVVVGGPETQTPILSHRVSYLEFRPYWNVPESLALEMVPKILADPGYLAARRLEVVQGWDEPARVVAPAKVPWKAFTHSLAPYRLRQKPGGGNALGLVKFMFPNEYSVYLHDTPERGGFLSRRRAFSNGCVRVEDPVRLAAFLLDGDARWPRAAIVKAMRTGGRQVVDLDAPVPVHLTYFTAWAEDGRLHLRDDVYGWDRAESLVAPAKASP